MPFTLRRATLGDADVLARFAQRLARESEGKKLDAETVRAGVRSVFEDERSAFYLVAEATGADAEGEGPRPLVAGALMVTTEWSDWRNGVFWWIQSVYVRRAYRRRGVYRRLHERVRQQAEASPDVCGLRLYVEQDNAAARAAYETLEMEETRYRLYECAW